MPTWTTDVIAGQPRIAVDHIGAGPLVVFLHGIGGNRSNWHDQLSEFGRHFHAVAWDARGYGDSDDYDGALDFGDFAIDLARVIGQSGRVVAARPELGEDQELDTACRGQVDHVERDL